MLKRLISGTLSAIICMTSIVPNHLSNYVRREAKAITKEVGDYDIKATNSLGNYIKGMSAKNDITSSLTQGFDSSRFQITSLEFDCETGVVQIASTQPSEAKIVVSFINDETSENILSLETDVEAGQLINSEIKVDSSKLSQYYLVKAQLFDIMNRPVGKAYTLSRFTKEVQEIIATDITAFDNEKVINLDDDDTTNFIVLSNDTVKAESSEEQNVLVSADYNNNIFVFENADETIASLEKGESLFIQPDEENIIALNVEKIEKQGDAVIVSGNDEIDDMFEFIKIESDGDVKRAKIDTSAADDGVVFPDIDENGNVIVEEDGSFNFEYEIPQYEIELSYSRSKEISIDALLSSNSNDDSDSKDFRPHDPYDDTEIDKSAKFSGSITFSVNFNLYKTFTTTDIECVIKITPSISFEGGVSIYNYTDKDTIPSVRSLAATIAEIIIPTSVPLVDLVLSPRIFCEISGKISATVKWDNIIGFAYKDGEFINKTKLFSPENFGGDFKLEGEIYAGLELKLYAEVISKKIASFGFDVKAGIRVTTDADITKLYELLKSKNTPQEKVILSSDKGDSYHACKFCMKFTTDFVIKCDLELHILGKDSEKNLLELAVNLPFLNAYLSFENGFGFGECDYKRYMVKFHDLTGSDNDFLPAVITLGDKKIRVSSKDTIFYCLPGSYSYDVSYNEESLRSGSITVSNAPLYISYLQGPGGEVTTGEPNMHEENSNHNEENSNHEFEGLSLPELSFEKNQTIIEAGKLGDHITYTLYPDGYLYIFGHGDMYTKTHFRTNQTIKAPFKDPSLVKNVIIENDGEEEDGGVITSIGCATFSKCKNLEKICMPHTIKRIDDYAFKECLSFFKITYYEYDYENYKLIKTEIPDGQLVMPKDITSIGSQAFANCFSFDNIVIADTVTEIGDYAFGHCNITSIEVPESVNKIGNYVFDCCLLLKTAVIKNCKDGIGYHIFNCCQSLENITLPYIGFSLEEVNKEESTQQLAYFFGAGNSDKYYGYVVDGITWSHIPKSLNTITITGGIRVPNYAFDQMKEVKKIILPKTINSLGDYSFANCNSLESIYIHDGVESIGKNAFLGCKTLTEISVPDTVKTIGEYAFSECFALKKAVINGGADGIGKYIFSECRSLNEIALPFAGFSAKDIVDNIRNELYDYFKNGRRYPEDKKEYYYNVKTIDYPQYVPISLKKITILGGTRIPDYAFNNLYHVESIILPNNITEIGENAFFNCYNLKKCDIPESVKSIGKYAFKSCTALNTINVPATVTQIGDFAFYNCSSLETVIIKGGADYIGDQIFSECNSLVELTLPFAGFSSKKANDPEVVEPLNNLFFKDYKQTTGQCPISLKRITILDGTRIPDYAFSNLNYVESIILPDTITEIGENAFFNCYNLKKCVIPESVKSIGDNSFTYCLSLNSITIPSTVTYIGNYVFSECRSLEIAVIEGGTDGIGDYIFNGCITLKELTLPFIGKSAKHIEIPGIHREISKYFDKGDRKSCYIIENSLKAIVNIPYSLKTINITGGKSIPCHAFYGMIGIKDVYLPKNINIIDDYAFNGCTGIINVFYPGTREEWEKNVTVGINNEEINGKVRFLGDEDNQGTTSTTTTPVITTTTSPNTTTNDVTIKTTDISINTTTEAITTPMTTITATSTTTTNVTIKTTADSANTSIATTTSTTSITTEINITTTTTEISEITETSTTTSAKMISETTSTIYETIKPYTTSYTTTVSQTTSTIITTEFIDKETEIEFGDASGDGKVDAVDAGIILMIYAKNSTSNPITLSPDQKLAYDVNEDGKVNALDASYILCYYAYISVSSNEPISLKNFMLKKE